MNKAYAGDIRCDAGRVFDYTSDIVTVGPCKRYVWVICKGGFCRVRILSVGYRTCHRTYRSFGYCTGFATKVTEISGIVPEVLQKPLLKSGIV